MLRIHTAAAAAAAQLPAPMEHPHGAPGLGPAQWGAEQRRMVHAM
jgi:hypothetical protein